MARSSKINVGPVIAALEATKEPGGRSFKGLVLDEGVSILESAYEFSSETPHGSRPRIVTRAVFAVARRGEITWRAVQAEIRLRVRKALSQPIQRHVIVTPLSTREPAALGIYRIAGIRVAVRERLPRRYDRSSISHSLAINNLVDRPKDFFWITVHVEGREREDAFRAGAHGLDLLRGLWNFDVNRRTSYRRTIGELPPPINQLRTGQVHTLHRPSGEMVQSGQYWYELAFSKAIAQKLPWERMTTQARVYRRRLRQVPDQEWAESMFVAYCRALDEADFSNCFLRLWSLLEHLTDTVGSRYDQLIRRACFLYKDSGFQRASLEDLRHRRNHLVHHSTAKQVDESLVYRLKGFVEHLLSFHVWMGARFHSHDEACQFLDHSSDIAHLRRRGALVREALRFCGA